MASFFCNTCKSLMNSTQRVTKCYRCNSELPPAPSSLLAAERLKACQACPHIVGDSCGLLKARGRGHKLMGHKGLPNPLAVCPDDPPRFLPVEENS